MACQPETIDGPPSSLFLFVGFLLLLSCSFMFVSAFVYVLFYPFIFFQAGDSSEIALRIRMWGPPDQNMRRVLWFSRAAGPVLKHAN